MSRAKIPHAERYESVRMYCRCQWAVTDARWKRGPDGEPTDEIEILAAHRLDTSDDCPVHGPGAEEAPF